MDAGSRSPNLILTAEPGTSARRCNLKCKESVSITRHGTVRAHAHERVDVVGDVAAFDRPVRLRWRKRRWRCRGSACAVVTWTERHAAIGKRAALTERARRWACRRVGRDGESVAAVAPDLGGGLAHRVALGVASRPAAGRRSGAPARCDRARMDETAFLRTNRHCHTTYVSGWSTPPPAGCCMSWPTAPPRR